MVFVQLDDVDPRCFETTYYPAPDLGEEYSSGIVRKELELAAWCDLWPDASGGIMRLTTTADSSCISWTEGIAVDDVFVFGSEDLARFPGVRWKLFQRSFSPSPGRG